MSDSSATPGARRPGTAPIAVLWILGVSLIAGATSWMSWAVIRLSSPTPAGDSAGSSAVVQAAYFFGPGLVGGGLALVGLALAVMAVRGVLEARDGRFASTAVSEPDAVFTSGIPSRSDDHGGPPPEAAASRPIDPEAFKRPRSASDPRP